MATLAGKERADYVRRMFSQAARRYDIANRWMAWRQDVKWRREVIDRASLPFSGILLDIGTGTGDLAWRVEGTRIYFPSGRFYTEMMHIGRMRQGGNFVHWLNTDALDLPFRESTFDAVVSGYLLRNVTDIERALAEQYRVVKQGGCVVCLDTTPPPNDLWHLPSRFYLRHIIPMIGSLIAGSSEAYRYLPQSTERFLVAEQLATVLQKVGFQQVQFRRFMGGTMAIHWGSK
jgi:demethylmenaquinone methyltransferase/2-methoxy-6-polyprenyl-1,4-benzoquinol methylase